MVRSDTFLVGFERSNIDNPILNIKGYGRKAWDEYYKDHHDFDISDKYCKECGARIIK